MRNLFSQRVHGEMSAADQYTSAIKYALAQMNGRQVRQNTMMMQGEDALLLASIGSPIVRRSLLPRLMQVSNEELFVDCVVEGAGVAFDMLQKVIDPSARQFGPDAFTISPCSQSGELLPENALPAYDVANYVRSKTVSLGDDRTDYYHATAVGIAYGLNRQRFRKQRAVETAVLRAVSEAGSYACDAVSDAARYAGQLVAANLEAISSAPGDRALPLYVRVDAMPDMPEQTQLQIIEVASV